jgi:hypothetical protein
VGILTPAVWHVALMCHANYVALIATLHLVLAIISKWTSWVLPKMAKVMSVDTSQTYL